MQVVVAIGSCDSRVKARIGWMKFRECGELLNSKRFLLKTKGMVYRSYVVRSVMLYMEVRHGV